MKRKVLRKVLAVALSAAMLAGTGFTTAGQFVGTDISVSASEVYGDFEYVVNDDNTVTITGYTGNGGNVTIPSKIGGKSVTSIGDWAFSFCDSLTSIIIPDSVISIDNHAFYYCESLANVEIGNGVTSIGDDSFEYCESLTNITIPDGVTSIGDYVFYSCKGLTNVEIGSGVTSIGDRAFNYCESLTNITIPDNVTSMGNDVFDGCTNLTNLKIGNGITSIGNRAFEDFTNLESVEIGNGVTSLDDWSFYGCTSLKSVKIGSGVTSIGVRAFEECTSLESVEIGSSVTSIGDWAFRNCTNLKSLIIPDSIVSIGVRAFEECTSLESVEIGSSVTSIGDWAFRNCTNLKSLIIPDSIVSIGGRAFEECTSLESVKIGSSVTSIGGWSFHDCTNLKSVEIGSSVTSIGSWVFCDCGDNLTIYGKKGSYAEEYANENDIPFVYIEAEASRYGIVGSMTGWGQSPDFPMYETETGVYVGKTDPLGAGDYELKVRADSTWVDCWGVYDGDYDRTYNSQMNIWVTLEEDAIIFVKLDTTGDDDLLWPLSYAILTDANEEPDWIYTGKEDDDDDDDDSEGKFGDFEYSVYDGRIQITGYTGNGENVVIPDKIDGKSVTSIGYYAFNCCTSLKSIVIPSSVTYIGGDAFYYCISLKSVVIPSSVTYIGCGAFNGCTSLTSVVIPGSVTEIDDSAFENCESLTSVTIENGVQKIGWWAFEDCTSLTSIVIPGSVTEIEIGAFERCTSLTSVTIENGVQTIDPCAFEDCTSLTSVTIPSSVTEIDSSVFGGCKELTIYGIKDSYAEDYAKANHIPFVSAVHEGEISLGEPVMIRASLICGSGDYKYAVLYKKKSDTKWVTRQNFSENDIVSLTLSDVGEYDICVKVKDSFGNIQKRFFTVTVIIPKLINQSVISKTEINIGSTVTATGMAEGGTGDYTYAVYYKKKTDSKWTTKQNYSTNDTVKIKPAKVADYDVCVKVKDSQGTIVKKYFTVTVNDNELNNTSIISSQTIKKGSTVTLNGFATGGAGDYTYAVLYKQKSQSKWTTKQNFNENSVVSVKPAQATDYDICIKVKDKDGTIVKKYFTVTVK